MGTTKSDTMRLVIGSSGDIIRKEMWYHEGND